MTETTIDGLDYAATGGIARITINQPDSLNALTPAMLDGMRDLLARAVDDGARAIILSGTGRAFCSGARLTGGRLADIDLGEVIDRHYNPVARAMAASPVPIVTAMNGLAAGAGVGLALAADIVVAAQSAYFLLAFANIGLVPDAGSTWLIGKAVGRARLLEMALLAERLPATQAAELGLISRVVPDDRVDAEADAVAAKLAAMPTVALGMIRQQVRAALDDGFEASLEAERANQSRAGRTHDHREGVTAFREKRPPVFEGR